MIVIHSRTSGPCAKMQTNFWPNSLGGNLRKHNFSPSELWNKWHSQRQRMPLSHVLEAALESLLMMRVVVSFLPHRRKKRRSISVLFSKRVAYMPLYLCKTLISIQLNYFPNRSRSNQFCHGLRSDPQLWAPVLALQPYLPLSRC